jgi:hypothetical protein
LDRKGKPKPVVLIPTKASISTYHHHVKEIDHLPLIFRWNHIESRDGISTVIPSELKAVPIKQDVVASKIDPHGERIFVLLEVNMSPPESHDMK